MNDTRGVPGCELNEYERDDVVPGISTFTYCPARKPSCSGVSRSIAKCSVESDSFSTAASVPSWRAAPVLHALDEAGTRITQSPRGRVWQASTMPWAASSAVSASSI